MNLLRKIIQNIINLLLNAVIPEEAGVEKLLKLNQSELRKALPRAERESDKNTFSIFNYQNQNVRSLVWGVKYKNHPELLKRAGEFLHEEIIEFASDKMIFENKHKIALIPIPTSKKRERERGWNQSLELCRAVAEVDRASSHNMMQNIMSVANILEKTKDTEHQQKLDRTKRLQNIRETMRANGGFDQDTLPIIIDDVTTTGATIKEARRALSALGFKEVLAITLAH